MNRKILIVEDEKDIVKMLEYALKKEGFTVVSVRNGLEAVNTAERERPDLVLLDLMLPGMGGLDVCKSLKSDRKTSGIPVIILTAKSQEIDKVIGLELGADDYMTKPFSPRELMARIKAVLRRTSGREVTSDVFTAGDLALDMSKIQVKVRNRPVELTSKEFELLKALTGAKGRVLSREYLLDTIWGIDESLEIETRTVDAHITTLRKKLKSAGAYIVTVKNYGYRFETEE